VLIPRTWPFAPATDQREPVAADGLVPFWDDGEPCSVGCRPPGALEGWPLRPFHRQHPLRAGLNELRTSSFHHGIDIQAADGSRVYAMQPGRAHILVASGPEERVLVGRYIYWHVNLRVHEGQVVVPFRTVLGTVKDGFGHLHLSEVSADGRYLNPLRPGGRVLAPWTDNDAPVLGAPHLQAGGRVTVDAFDPQSFTERVGYETPVIAPAAVAYRMFDARGTPVTPLRFALRGAQNLDWSVHALVFAPDAREAAFVCFMHRVICRPHWDYVLAGGLAPALPLSALAPGRYRLAAYAWDWAGNASARDTWLQVGAGRATVLAPPALGRVGACATTCSAAGGAGVVSLRGTVGALAIDRSTARDVIAFAGAPSAVRDRPGAAGVPPSRALLYGCGSRCLTVYFLNRRTGRLSDFFSTSSGFSTARGTRPGMTLRAAQAAEGRRARLGCFDRIARRGRRITIGIDFFIHYNARVMGRARVSDLHASSVEHSVLPRVCR
jgi:murein DD-endopeptidase MepM/ murein hydrolase activator NlpD